MENQDVSTNSFAHNFIEICSRILLHSLNIPASFEDLGKKAQIAAPRVRPPTDSPTAPHPSEPWPFPCQPGTVKNFVLPFIQLPQAPANSHPAPVSMDSYIHLELPPPSPTQSPPTHPPNDYTPPELPPPP